MKILIFQGFFILLFFLMQNNVFAQNFASYTMQYEEEKTENFEKLFSAVQNGTALLVEFPDLSDFNARAQHGLDFMSPGATIQNLICTAVSDWSLSLEEELRTYLLNFYEKDIEQWGDNGIELVLDQWRQEKLRCGLMFWEVVHDGNSKTVTSIAVFDRNGKILFDTELVNFIVGVTPFENSQSVTQKSNGSEGGLPINNVVSKTTTPLSWLLEGVLGQHVTLNWSVSGTAEVAPYVTAATNDAVFNFATDQIHCWRSNPSPLPPGGDPMVYFGRDGMYANLYENSIPFKSRIYFDDSVDHFFNGIYSVTGFNGRTWSFGFDFSVTAGPFSIGITPSQNNGVFTLTAQNSSDITLNNYTYASLINPYEYVAFFWNNGGLQLNNFNVRTGSGGHEVGTVTMYLPVQVGFTFAGVLSLFPDGWTNPPREMTLNVEYLRGDAIHQPSFEVTSSSYSVALGQIDTIKTTVINNSNYINLEGGDVSLDVSSLNNKLVLLSSATLPVETIEENNSKEFLFVVQGNEEGFVTPQVNLTNIGWETPVPPEVKINTIASIDSTIVVGNPSGVEDETNNVLTYELYKNYPNPFNPSTTIKYDLPEANFVSMKVYDVLGREVGSLVNEQKQAGRYEINFDASSLSSGTYFYRIQAGGFVEIKKMVLLK